MADYFSQLLLLSPWVYSAELKTFLLFSIYGIAKAAYQSEFFNAKPGMTFAGRCWVEFPFASYQRPANCQHYRVGFGTCEQLVNELRPAQGHPQPTHSNFSYDRIDSPTHRLQTLLIFNLWSYVWYGVSMTWTCLIGVSMSKLSVNYMVCANFHLKFLAFQVQQGAPNSCALVKLCYYERIVQRFST